MSCWEFEAKELEALFRIVGVDRVGNFVEVEGVECTAPLLSNGGDL